MTEAPEAVEQQAAPALEAQPTPDEVHVIDVNHFAGLVARWFQARSQQLRHLLEVPEGTGFEIGEDKLVLEGQVLKGFKFGVELAIMQLGTLPFSVEFEDDPVPTPAPEAAPAAAEPSGG